MLSLRKSCYHIKAVHRFVGATRCSSVLKKSEIVVSEVKHLASVAIKLYDSHDLDQQMKLLCELRSADASGREEVVSVFSKKYPRIASTWLADWVCKSAVGGNTAKLFPVIIPVDDVNLSLDVKSDLADAVYAIKMSNKGTGVVENESVMRTQAMKLADELGDSIHIDRLRKVGSVFQDFVDAPIPIASFLDELVCESGLFANKLQPLLEFTELPVPQKIHDQMLESENDRQHIHARLVDELTYVTHVVNSSRFNAEAQTAEVQTQVSAVELIKGLSEAPSADYKDRFPEKEHLRRSVIIGNAADFAGFEPSSLLQISDTGLVHTRRAIDSRRKLRFSADIFLFNVKAPCYRVGHGLQGAARRDAATSSLNFDHGLLVKSMDAALADPADLPDIHVHPPAVDDQALHESMPNRKIMIDNLPRDITEGGLRDALRKCGNIEKVWIFKDERATPEEVKYMNALRLRQPRTSGTFVDLSNTEGPFNLQLEGTMLLPSADRGEGEDEARSRAAAVAGELDSELMEDADVSGDRTVMQEEAGVTSYEKLLKEQNKAKIPTKQKLLRGSLKTDNYAFVLMADEPSYQLISKPAVRLFGITIGERSCRVYPSHIYKSFMLEIGQELDVRGTIELVNTLLKGRYECYASPTYQNCKPVFLHLQFENATDAWMAHDMLMRALDELNRNSLVLTRKVLWRARATLGARKLISVNLSWIKSQWYKEWFFRASKYLERKEDQAAIQQQVSEDDLRLQQLHQTKPQPQAPPRTANPQWHDELNSIDIDAVQEEIEQRAAKRSQSRRGGASAADATKGSDSSATSAKGKTGSKTDTTAASPRSGAKKRVANQPPRLIQTAKGSSSPSTTTSRSTSAVENTLSSLIKVTAAYSDTERLQSEASNGLGGSASTVDIKVKKFMFASAKSAAVAGGARAKKATIASRASAAEKKAPLSAAANKSAKSNSTATSGKAAARSRTPGKATKAAAGSVDKTTVAPSRARARAKAKSAPATSEK